MHKSKIKLTIFILLVLFSNNVLSEAYFDISEDNIKIETNFTGKEVIIFGILNDGQETIMTIKGPEKNSVIQKKERILGFWFNTKQITYNQIMAEYDAVMVFLVATLFVGIYIFNEARPKGSSLISKVRGPFSRFFK